VVGEMMMDERGYPSIPQQVLKQDLVSNVNDFYIGGNDLSGEPGEHLD
jgi:hypothetical protein